MRCRVTLYFPFPYSYSVFLNVMVIGIIQRTNSKGDKLSPQGCALTAPGRLRRLTFGLGRPKIYSWSPGRAICWCWFLVLQSIRKKKMLFNRVCVDIQRSFQVNSRVTYSSTLIMTSCTVFDLTAFPYSIIIFPLNLDGWLVFQKKLLLLR